LYVTFFVAGVIASPPGGEEPVLSDEEDAG
jgi:hypothetical protein